MVPYRLIAIDLDGTLLDTRGEISPANRDAIARAQQAGVQVVPCTGRGWREARFSIAEVPGWSLGVFITGAVVAEIATGQSRDFSVIEPHLALELVDFLAGEPEAVLVYREPNLAGHEYLVTGRGTLTDNTQWWFDATGAKVHHQRKLRVDDLHHTLRVGMVASAACMPVLEKSVSDAFGDRVLVHSFAALTQEREEDSVHILEIFARGVNKWHGLRWIAEHYGIAPAQVAAIGDEVNDLSMLDCAGCGVAMGNATADAKQRADHITLTNDEHGVAHAIEQLLAGRWG